jgi:hypothetical protein
VLSGSETYGWIKAQVQEARKVSDFDNVLFFELIPNTDIVVGATLFVSGLTGTSDPDSSSIVIGQLRPGTTGTWVNAAGLASFRLLDAVPRGNTLRFSLSLRNPPQSQPAVQPRLSVQMEVVLGGQPVTIIIPEVALQTIDGCCLSSGDSPRFLRATARESTNVPGQLNQLIFELQSNIALPFGTKITLSGMTGGPTKSTSMLRVSNSSEILAEWSEDPGAVTLSVVNELYNCECLPVCDRDFIRFSIQLANPLRRQDAPSVFARASGVGFVIDDTAVDGILLQADGAPMLAAVVMESSNVTSQDNVITIEMFANMALDVCKSEVCSLLHRKVASSFSLLNAIKFMYC